MLKAAYIGAFAKFGYRYILQPALDLVRRQVLEPEIDHLGKVRGFSLSLSEWTAVLPENALLSFHDPVKHIAAKIGSSMIRLPLVRVGSRL